MVVKEEPLSVAVKGVIKGSLPTDRAEKITEVTKEAAGKAEKLCQANKAI